MRFVSKSTNLRVMLRPGIQANPLSGQAAVPAIFVRFQNGIADLKDQDIIDMMLAHPGFNSDYIAVDDGGNDPYSATRQESEPAHSIAEIENGRVQKLVSSPVKKVLPPELQKLVQEQALELAKAMVPEMIQTLIKSGAVSPEKKASKPTGKKAKKYTSTKKNNVVTAVEADEEDIVTPIQPTLEDAVENTVEEQE